MGVSHLAPCIWIYSPPRVSALLCSPRHTCIPWRMDSCAQQSPYLYHSFILQRSIQEQRWVSFAWGHVISGAPPALKQVQGWWHHTMWTHTCGLISFSLVSSALHYNILSILPPSPFPNSNWPLTKIFSDLFLILSPLSYMNFICYLLYLQSPQFKHIPNLCLLIAG